MDCVGWLLAHSNMFLRVLHVYVSGDTLKDVVSGRFEPRMLEPEPDYPSRIVTVLSTVRRTTGFTRVASG